MTIRLDLDILCRTIKKEKDQKMAAVLTWIKSKKAFLKVQEGIGDALSWEDLKDGMQDYVLWSTFRPECIDDDETLDMNLLDGGILMSDKAMTADGSISGCYSHAFNVPYDADDVVVLMHEEDCEA